MFVIYSLLGIGIVVLLHNLGYFLAMRLVGLNDPQVYLLPWLMKASRDAGTLAKAPVWQQLLVLLAGPGPALVFTAVNSLMTSGPWTVILKTSNHTLDQILLPASLGLFFINWLTLLPIKPLPGGRLFELLCGRSSYRAPALVGLLLLMVPMRMELRNAVIILRVLLPGLLCMFIGMLATRAISQGQHGAVMIPRAHAAGPTLWVGAGLYLLFYCAPLITDWLMAARLDPPWHRFAQARAESAKLADLHARIAASKAADERVGLYLALADVVADVEHPAASRQAVRDAFGNIDPKQPGSLFAVRARIRYTYTLESGQLAAALGQLGLAEVALQKYHPDDAPDFEALYSARAYVLDETEAPADSQIANMRMLIAVAERGSSIEDVLQQQLDLAGMLLKNNRTADAIAVLQSAFRDAHRANPKSFNAGVEATNIVCELMWLQLASGQPQAALAVAADPLVQTPLIDREQDPNANDPYDGSEEQARGYALIDAGQPAAAVPIFTHFLDKEIKRYGDDSGGLGGPLLLDLLVAQKKAGLPTQDTVQHMRRLFLTDPKSLPFLRGELRQDGEQTTSNFSAYRARQELIALQTL